MNFVALQENIVFNALGKMTPSILEADIFIHLLFNNKMFLVSFYLFLSVYFFE